MAEETEKLPQEEVEITMALCKVCSKAFFAGVKHTLGKDAKKELGNAAADGCEIKTIPFLEYKAMCGTDWWCECKTEKRNDDKRRN